MAKFYDSTTYPPAGTLIGGEVFIIYQSGQSRTTTFDAVLSDIIHPFIDNLELDDLGDVTITSPSNGDVLIYSDGFWSNADAGLVSMDEIQDVSVSSPQIGQMLIWNGSLWQNDNNPELRSYTETEYNIGSISGVYTILLTNGNIQRLSVAGSLDIALPSMPSVNQNWRLTLKVIYDGVNVPTFISVDGTLKWQGDTTPSDLGVDGSMNIYVFTSDVFTSEVYGNLIWCEE